MCFLAFINKVFKIFFNELPITNIKYSQGINASFRYSMENPANGDKIVAASSKDGK